MLIKNMFMNIRLENMIENNRNRIKSDKIRN